MNHNIKFQKVLLMDFPWVQDKQLSLTKFLGTESPQDRRYCKKDSRDELCSIVCGRKYSAGDYFPFFGIGICKQNDLQKKTNINPALSSSDVLTQRAMTDF